MAKKNNNLDSLIEESLDNIRQDRAVASTLLVDIVSHIKTNKHEHKESGQVAAKYLETLQRSNEQLVKLNTLLFKKSSMSDGLTDHDKEELYNLINKEE
tara:strand:- start:3853 stop:4149 length:297 start_codon:yes stop_codon:yes gene_type:complete